jgi:hypothetical protein
MLGVVAVLITEDSDSEVYVGVNGVGESFMFRQVTLWAEH